MPRISGLEKNQAPWHLRWFYRVMQDVRQRPDAGKDAEEEGGSLAPVYAYASVGACKTGRPCLLITGMGFQSV